MKDRKEYMKEYMKNYMKKWYEEHKQERLAYFEKYRKDHHAEILEWHRSNNNKYKEIHMNIYKAIYVINKKTKEIKNNRISLKRAMDDHIDVNKESDLYKRLGEEYKFDPWFPYKDYYCTNNFRFKDINDELNEAGENLSRCDSRINYFECEIQKTDDPDEIQEYKERISEEKVELDIYESIYGYYSDLLNKFEIVQDNRENAKEKLRDMRKEQIKLYAMKDKAISILQIPIVEIHVIDGTYYNYHEYIYDGIIYKFHTKRNEKDDAAVNVHTHEIQYEDIIVDIEDADFDAAYAMVKSLIEENIGWDNFEKEIAENDKSVEKSKLYTDKYYEEYEYSSDWDEYYMYN